ncbi:MAG: efflux RND transporter periplasmic adaptor subunit [Thermodesulfobacteriota bacterium]
MNVLGIWEAERTFGIGYNGWAQGGRAAGIAAFCALILLVGACAKKEAPKHERPPALVSTAMVVKQDTPYVLKGIGHVKAFRTVDVKPRVTGLLLTSKIKGGQHLRQGQLIFTIDPEPFEAALKEAQAAFEQAKARLQQAERDLKRFHAIFEAKGISADEYEQKRLDKVSKEFQAALEEARVTIAKLNLDYTKIYSPLDGQAGDIFIDERNTVTAYQSVLVNVRQIEPIRVEFSLPGKFLQEIRQYSNREDLAVEAHIPGSPDPETGSLYLIDNVVNPKTGMIMIQGEFQNHKRRLWPGQFVNVELRLTTIKDAIQVPSPAVMDGPAGRYVWVVKSDETVEMRPVVIERSYRDKEIVAQGLKAGERVVTDGQMMLYPGAKVQERKPPEKHPAEESQRGTESGPAASPTPAGGDQP